MPDSIHTKRFLGVELGSTRIKAVVIDEHYHPIVSGDHTWTSRNEHGIWTYSLDEVWAGLRAALSQFEGMDITAMGISGMMHGYLAFDENWNLLTPFRTWQNTITAQAAEELTALFGFNIPQRWSIAHLYQAILNEESHVNKIRHITTLAGYVHYMLTGQNVVGIGEASGMFPIDSKNLCYDQGMMEQFNVLIAGKGVNWTLQDLLPEILLAGESAGTLTERGAMRLGGALKPGIPFCPPEGDAGTGMTATNAVAPRTGNVSAGTSIFSMVVLEKPLKRVHPEIDLVTTPSGNPVAMVHCNNCTGDMNAWIGILREAAAIFGSEPEPGVLYTKLYEKSMEGDPDCGGLLVYNYLAGEGVTHLDRGCPLVVRDAGSSFTLENFLRAQLYSTMATLKIGMDILAEEGVAVDSLNGHGGLFKTPVVGQSYLAAACNVPVTCMETAGEGGPYGMALLAAYMEHTEKSLEEFLAWQVFRGVKRLTIQPKKRDVDGFEKYLEKYKKGFAVEQAAITYL